MDCHFLLQRIFLTQELNLNLLHCRQILYQLSYEESPKYSPWHSIIFIVLTMSWIVPQRTICFVVISHLIIFFYYYSFRRYKILVKSVFSHSVDGNVPGWRYHFNEYFMYSKISKRNFIYAFISITYLPFHLFVHFSILSSLSK